MNTVSVYSPYAKKAIDVGRAEHMIFRVRDDLDYREGWVGEILNSDSTYITPQIAPRVALVERTVPVNEWRIYHEAPKLLPAPKQEKGTYFQRKHARTHCRGFESGSGVCRAISPFYSTSAVWN